MLRGLGSLITRRISRPSRSAVQLFNKSASKRAYSRDKTPALALYTQTITPSDGPFPNKLRNMVFLHGLFGNGGNWRTVAQNVTNQAVINTHLVDIRNHGLSPHSDVMTFDAMADDLMKLIEDKNLGRITLLGHSMGGKMAMTFAQKYPEAVQKLVVVDVAPVGYKDTTTNQEIIYNLMDIDLDKLKTRKEADEQLKPYIPDIFIRGFLLQNLLFNNETQKFYWRFNLKVLNEQLRTIMQMDTMPGAPYMGDTMFVVGELSEYYKPEYEPEVKKHFPRAIIKSIPGAGHYLHFEKAAEFLSVLVPFVTSRRFGKTDVENE